MGSELEEIIINNNNMKNKNVMHKTETLNRIKTYSVLTLIFLERKFSFLYH